MEGKDLGKNVNPVKKNKTDLTSYGQRFVVNYGTLYKYFRDDISKRNMLGFSIGAKPLMTTYDNEELNRMELIDKV